MPSHPISSTLTNHLHQTSPAPLQITFATLAIHNSQNGQFLNHVHRPHSRIVLKKMPCQSLAELTVPDNLVFSFSFQFRIPKTQKFHHVEMLSLPRPLDHGKLFIDEEKLVLSFRIDAPDPSLRVEVTHTYLGICDLKELCAPVPEKSLKLHNKG
ncbi:hypothetical protein K1F50_05010 [Muricauda oceani]|uniref:Uncharacterized protein n=1 Tax=Flagellimonas oceani TaxID=2698672 RepID=A0A6G7J614_9FLAO|nr:hypothetical protein [Allomuricauda oceani]MBW8242148.1 hypothetical protein [Allomuricauda oceani]QII45912.1 hypothetical protein GVT53_14935 [Allomuricauda oceani]